MIYALKVAIKRTEELRWRGIQQDDNAVLPREFLGRCCFAFTLFTPVLFPCDSLAVFRVYHVHVIQEGVNAQAARPVHGLIVVEAVVSGAHGFNGQHRPSLIFIGDYYFTVPGFGPLWSHLTWSGLDYTLIPSNWPFQDCLECLWSLPRMPLDGSAVSHRLGLHSSFSSATKFQWEARCLVTWSTAFKMWM